MKKKMVVLLSGISVIALLAGGCANKETVKKEEPLVSAAPIEKTEPAKPVEVVKPVEASNEIKPAQDETAQMSASRVETPSPAVVLETAYFDFDKSDLRQDTRDVLSKNAETILKSLPDAKIQIEGHCDERGSAEYNLALGERRAKSAQQYLITLGVKGANLSVISYGKEKPAVCGNDEAAWAKNRRAEFVIVK